MTPRLYDRLAAGLSLLLLLALAGATYYLAEIAMRQTGPGVERVLGHEPDYFVEGLVFTRINQRGDPVFRISAERMLHYADDDSTAYTKPVAVSLDPSKPRLTLRADEGSSDAGGNETHLHGNVIMERAATPSEPAMVATTEQLVLHSDTEIAVTDLPVRVVQGESVLTGVGMEFNNAARSLRVDSQVRITWQPRPKPP
ncbi:MAG: LPS export ABC transporter periplasmic protein LptC [Burkholderiaceae bacterium]